MSRRASLLLKERSGQKARGVRFPDDLVFLENIKENDVKAVSQMLRRASVKININAIGDAGIGLTPHTRARTHIEYS